MCAAARPRAAPLATAALACPAAYTCRPATCRHVPRRPDVAVAAALQAPAGGVGARRRSPACSARGLDAPHAFIHGAAPCAARLARPLAPPRRASQRRAALHGGPAESGAVATAAHRGEGNILAAGAALLAAAVGYGVFTLGVDETMTAAKGVLVSFSDVVRGSGPAGWLLYVATYAGLEVLLLPATPLALTAGALFGVVPGTLLSAAAGVTGATTSFLLARYAFRDRVLSAAQDQPNFAAIDRAIGRDGFKVVLLVNLSPLSSLQNLLNYGYGVTSIPLQPYVLASGLALLPKTWACVSAGTMGRSLLEGEEGGLALGAGMLVAVAATVYIAGVAKVALAEMEAESGTAKEPERAKEESSRQ